MRGGRKKPLLCCDFDVFFFFGKKKKKPPLTPIDAPLQIRTNAPIAISMLEVDPTGGLLDRRAAEITTKTDPESRSRCLHAPDPSRRSFS
jgi:hypothetical protein